MLKSLSSQNASLPWPATEVVQRALPVFFQDISAGILVALKGRGLLIPQHKDSSLRDGHALMVGVASCWRNSRA